MAFVYPNLLWALALVAIPVIIHLFNFRKYKKVYFTNVRFLRELQHESKSKSRLKEILILLTRCLAMACLILAFCQPVWLNDPQNKQSSLKKVVGLYLDNSFSTNNINKQGPVADLLKLKAAEVVKAFGNSARYYLLTNDFEGKHQRFYSDEEILKQIDEVKISPTERLLSDVIKRQADFLNSEKGAQRFAYLFSDAQQSTFNLGQCEMDTNIRSTLVPVNANKVNNLYVDSCWFQTPVQQFGVVQKLHAHIRNLGDHSTDVGTARLLLNGTQVALASFSMIAGGSAEVQFAFECKVNGFNFGSIQIDDYPITFDDQLFFAFNSKVHIRVCIINGSKATNNQALNSLFASDSMFVLNTFSEQAIDYGKLKATEVLILNQPEELSSGLQSELEKFKNKGGVILINPSKTSNSTAYNTVLSTLGLPVLSGLDTTQINADLPSAATGFYDGVFEKLDPQMNLPNIKSHFKVQLNQKNNAEVVLQLQNGDPLLTFSKIGSTKAYLLTSPLNENAGNFIKHALFVPTMYKLCFSGLSQQNLFLKVGEPAILNMPSVESTSELPPLVKKTDSTFEVIPERRIVNNAVVLYLRQLITAPGFYKLEQGTTALLPLAFNYSRRESHLTAYTETELQNIVDGKAWKNVRVLVDTQTDISKTVLQEADGKKLWKLFIILTLVFMGIELLLLRLLK